MGTPFDVAVLGAGPAGLATALGASRRGMRVAVFERAPRVGGLAGSFELDGHRVDYGSHRLHVATPPATLDMLRRLLGDELQLRARNGRIRLEGRWLGFPLRVGDIVRNAPPSLTLGAITDVIASPLRTRRAAADTFSAQVRRGLGRTIATRFYEPYARKLWDVDAGDLSGELFRRRVSAGSATSLLRRIRAGSDPMRTSFWYPRRGFGRISEALADAAVDAGVELRLGAEVTGIDEIRSLATTVISTVPASTTVGLYGGEADDAVVRASTALSHRAVLLVYLVLDKSRYSPFDAHYLPDPSVPVARVSEPKNYRDDPSELRRTTVICAEVPANVGDQLWTTADADLGVIVADALAKSAMPPLGHVARVRVKRVANVYPVYRVGFERDLAVVEDWASTRDELLLVGRQALFAHDNTHHALAMGAAAAACLRDDATIDRERWAVAREGFRDHVVED